MLAAKTGYTEEAGKILRNLWVSGADADPAHCAEHPWLAAYQSAGREALSGYLGTKIEQNFEELSAVLARFKAGEEKIWLKRMGRTPDALWYEEVDFSNVHVLLVEWTHGNSTHLIGVDLPILLNSTPAETLAHRRARNRDGKPDSAFITMVLDLEQKKLESQAHKAKIILSKSGELLTYSQYRQLMAAE